MGTLNGLFAVIALVLFALSFYMYVTAASTMWLIGWFEEILRMSDKKRLVTFECQGQ